MIAFLVHGLGCKSYVKAPRAELYTLLRFVRAVNNVQRFPLLATTASAKFVKADGMISVVAEPN